MPQAEPSSSDYYKRLGVERNADEAAIKKAYRKGAMKYNPDKNPDNAEAAEKFQRLAEAYETLSDSSKRRMYDQYGEEGARAADQMPEGGGFAGGGFGGMPGGVHFSSSGMNPQQEQDLFESMFGDEDPFSGFGMSFGGPGTRMGGMGGGGLESLLAGMMGGGLSPKVTRTWNMADSH